MTKSAEKIISRAQVSHHLQECSISSCWHWIFLATAKGASRLFSITGSGFGNQIIGNITKALGYHQWLWPCVICTETSQQSKKAQLQAQRAFLIKYYFYFKDIVKMKRARNLFQNILKYWYFSFYFSATIFVKILARGCAFTKSNWIISPLPKGHREKENHRKTTGTNTVNYRQFLKKDFWVQRESQLNSTRIKTMEVMLKRD